MATKATSKVLLASAVAGMLALTGLSASAQEAKEAKGEKVKCYGVNECKGHGACGGAGHACAGQNACKGQGFIEVDSKDACLKMEGGRLTPNK
jgi:uncharacterized membrane protein